MISVCIATHNGEKYIKEQLESILCQLSPDDEVIVSDDGSSDSTLDIILAFHDVRIRLFQKLHERKDMTPHYYVTMNFENALKHANGDFIFLSDQDDVWVSNKVERCIKALQTYDLVIHNLECVDSELIPLNRNVYNNGFRFKNYLMRRGKHYGCALAFRKEILKYILPFPKNLILHDFWIGIIGETFGNAIFLDEILVKYRVHGFNTSGTLQKKNSLLYIINYRLYLLFNLVVRFIRFTK